jgi:hypothetical protein
MSGVVQKLNTNTNECERCSKKFSTFIRRHHCRLCGYCVCHACSDKKIVVEGNLVRACAVCLEAQLEKASRCNEVQPRVSAIVDESFDDVLSDVVVSVQKDDTTNILKDTPLDKPTLEKSNALKEVVETTCLPELKVVPVDEIKPDESLPKKRGNSMWEEKQIEVVKTRDTEIFFLFKWQYVLLLIPVLLLLFAGDKAVYFS